MAETITLRPADLLIDEQNPRISEPNEGQHKALQALARQLGQKIAVLAADIVQYGLNPSDLPIVMPFGEDPGRFVVLEGNRRLAALRALESPESLGDSVDTRILTSIRRLSREYQQNPIDSIACSVFRSREEARHWIELRHTGENGGAGIVAWGSDESANWNARNGKPRDIHSQALDFLQRRGDLTIDLRRQVPVTSFKRLLETPAVRARLGLSVRRRTLYIANETRVAKALMHVIHDLASRKTKVSAIYTRAQREKYARDLPNDVAAPATSSTTQWVAASGGGSPATSAMGGGRRNPIRRERNKLIPRDCVLNISGRRVADIEGELRRLYLDEHKNAISVLLRVFIELSADTYIETRALGVTAESTLRKKLEATLEHLLSENKLTRPQATPVRRALQKDSFLAPSIDLMHNYVHNPHVFPAPADLRANWDNLQPFLAAMWMP